MTIKTIKDYYKDVEDAFPEVSKRDIERMLKFGWNSLYLHNVYGGDVKIEDTRTQKFVCYIGSLTYDALKHFNYYIRKLVVKIRVMYNRAKEPWDGYYYFSLSDDQYQYYLSQIKKVGVKRKTFLFNGRVCLYKIFKECKVRDLSHKYFFRAYMGVDLGYRYFKDNWKTNRATFYCELVRGSFKTLNR